MMERSSRSKQAKPMVILWDRGDISGWNLTLVLQMAGCQVHPVNNLDEGLNLARMASETDQGFACMVGRGQYLLEAETGRCLENLGEGGFSLPFVVLKAHAEEPLATAALRRCCASLLLCSPMTLLETVSPLLETWRRHAS